MSLKSGKQSLRNPRRDRMPNHSVEANRRPAAPLEGGSQFGSSFSARPVLPAAVAHLWRSA